VLDAGISKALILAQLSKHCMDLTLSEAHATETWEELCLDVEHLWLERLTIRGSIAMPEANPTRRVLFDEERSTMDRSVVSTTYGKDICWNVATTLGTQLDVVQIEKRRVFATRHLAAVLIAHEHGPAQGGRDRLRRANGNRGVVGENANAWGSLKGMRVGAFDTCARVGAVASA
jgi:hypothetical protein